VYFYYDLAKYVGAEHGQYDNLSCKRTLAIIKRRQNGTHLTGLSKKTCKDFNERRFDFLIDSEIKVILSK
jgi:hypothetical protein